jgi:SAM-dependent methyltransferase
VLDAARRLSSLDPKDREIVETCLSVVDFIEIDAALSALASGLSEEARAAFRRHCRVSNVAAMIFPRSVPDLIRDFKADSIDVTCPVPSVVARDRLSIRHGVLPQSFPVSIMHLQTPGSSQGNASVELFVLESTVESKWLDFKRRERTELNETHLTFNVCTGGNAAAVTLHELLVNQGRMMPGSCGYDEFEDCTILYYSIAGDTPPGPVTRMFRCLELRIPGHCAHALDLHRRARNEQTSEISPSSSASSSVGAGPPAPEVPTHDAATQLLRLMTGAWATQAIAVAAKMGLPDYIPKPNSVERPASVDALAQKIGASPTSLARLLQYLDSIGIVTRRDELYTLTELGALLCDDVPYSMRALARMYGGPFYQSFSCLEEAVRTGRDGFTTRFGQGHFEYFAEHAELAELFDDSMAASVAMFEPVAELDDFADARSVVDIAGGNGRLLYGILQRWPHLRGTLFETASVVERARASVADSDCLDRCDFVVGDFTEAIPAGADVYVLSRVLHDWNDEKCVEILRRCATAMRDGARLFVIERLLNTTGPPTLASAWDLHMLCNVGGRERTAPHYAQLLARAGVELKSIMNLPLDGHLLICRRGHESHLDSV